MDKPKIIDYVEIPRSTTSGICYNYKQYSVALETYIKYLEDQVEKLNISAVDESFLTKCDVCGCHPSTIIHTEFGVFCPAHARYVR